MPYLTEIQYLLPDRNKHFKESFVRYICPAGRSVAGGFRLNVSRDDFLPETAFAFRDCENPCVVFEFDEGRPITVEIANTTGMHQESPYKYSPLSLDGFIQRVQPFPLLGVDHTGFNLPYFRGVHPIIQKLRRQLRDKCLYHTFPKHLEDAPWDFIIPGTKEEIDQRHSVDYRQVRKPKIELVSFENSSTPLIQIELHCQGTYEDMAKAFPEAIHVPEIRNMWVYIQNDYDIDICFVLNEASSGDWSYEFCNERLL